MTTLDRVMEMQQQGSSDAEIAVQLQNEGVSPSEISDSLNQSKIKNAISPAENTTQEPQQPAPTQQGMQTSIMDNATKPPAKSQVPKTKPITSEVYEPNMEPPVNPEIYQPQEQTTEQPQDYYYQQPEQQDYYASQQGGIGTETISEIAEQVATEKINNYKKKTGDIVVFKNMIQDKVNDIDDRLKRIEKNIDKLQQAVIGKVGEFGENNAMIHKDLNNLHETVSKLMNPLIDNYNELKRISK